jgi:choline ABC transporter permease protein
VGITESMSYANYTRNRTQAYSAALLLIALSTCLQECAAASAAAHEPESCRAVRFSDVGWTDITATTAVTSEVLRRLGYQPLLIVLSVAVTYAAMRNKDIDVFLGNWMPSQAAIRQPFLDDHSVAVVRANLTGAKMTLATTERAYDSGLRDFSDLARFGSLLEHKIYGIEPGAGANRHVLDMIKSNAFGLGNFQLVESSEQGMLGEVERSIRTQRPIVFLGWEPHPMSMRLPLRYLAGGDTIFGPNYGHADVFTVARASYLQQCPNVAQLLQNLEFTLRAESEMMDLILDKGEAPQRAARSWLEVNPEVLRAWLKDVKTWDGKPALSILNASAGASTIPRFERWITSHKIPFGDATTAAIGFLKQHGTVLFDGVSTGIRKSVDAVYALLVHTPAPLLILASGTLAWFLRRSIASAIFVVAALLLIVNQGYWAATLETLSLVLVAALLCALVGVPVGVLAAHHPRLYQALRPVLDLMQTLPTFVYLIPTLVLFGLGIVPGLISTVIFALPAPIRLTHLGITSVPKPLLEAGEAFGATRMQLLWKVELPSAAPAIVAGITQCIMLSLSMVVIAALVGAGGLGVPVVRALSTVQVGMGFEAGFAIVLVAIVLDRITRPRERLQR